MVSLYIVVSLFFLFLVFNYIFVKVILVSELGIIVYIEELGRMIVLSYFVIVIFSMVLLIVVFWYFFV